MPIVRPIIGSFPNFSMGTVLSGGKSMIFTQFKPNPLDQLSRILGLSTPEDFNIRETSLEDACYLSNLIPLGRPVVTPDTAILKPLAPLDHTALMA